MIKVICFGEVLWDKFLTGSKPGGAPMNVAIHLTKQGVDSLLISSVGHDEDGEKLKAFINAKNVSSNYIQLHKSLPTGAVEVALDNEKQATYTIVNPVAWDEIQYNQNLNHIVEAADALVFGSLACRREISRKTLFQLFEFTKLAVFDMNVRLPHLDFMILGELLHRCDILKINEHELEILIDHFHIEANGLENQLKKLSHAINTRIICITLGDKGAAVLDGDSFYNHPGFSVIVADTVGAGDAFLATFLAGYLRKRPMETVLEESCAIGAFVATKEGANPDYQKDDVFSMPNFNLTKR